MSPVRIGVVGGGLAGIAAALAAADGGAEVVLVERRPALGGLTTSIQRNGLSFDNGQHVFLRCCTAYRDFLERIGAAEQVFVQARLDLPVLAPDGSAPRSDGRRCPLRCTFSGRSPDTGTCRCANVCSWPALRSPCGAWSPRTPCSTTSRSATGSRARASPRGPSNTSGI